MKMALRDCFFHHHGRKSYNRKTKNKIKIFTYIMCRRLGEGILPDAGIYQTTRLYTPEYSNFNYKMYYSITHLDMFILFSTIPHKDTIYCLNEILVHSGDIR
jgi:hypothetical protein